MGLPLRYLVHHLSLDALNISSMIGFIIRSQLTSQLSIWLAASFNLANSLNGRSAVLVSSSLTLGNCSFGKSNRIIESVSSVELLKMKALSPWRTNSTRVGKYTASTGTPLPNMSSTYGKQIYYANKDSNSAAGEDLHRQIQHGCRSMKAGS